MTTHYGSAEIDPSLSSFVKSKRNESVEKLAYVRMKNFVKLRKLLDKRYVSRVFYYHFLVSTTSRFVVF